MRRWLHAVRGLNRAEELARSYGRMADTLGKQLAEARLEAIAGDAQQWRRRGGKVRVSIDVSTYDDPAVLVERRPSWSNSFRGYTYRVRLGRRCLDVVVHR